MQETHIFCADKRDIADVSTREDVDEKLVNEKYESKHTIESDEEEEYDKQEKYQRLDLDKVNVFYS